MYIFIRNYIKHWKIHIIAVLLVAFGTAVPTITGSIIDGMNRSVIQFTAENVLGSICTIEPAYNTKFDDGFLVSLSSGLEKEFPNQFKTLKKLYTAPEKLAMYRSASEIGEYCTFAFLSSLEPGYVLMSAETAGEKGLKEKDTILLADSDNPEAGLVAFEVSFANAEHYSMLASKEFLLSTQDIPSLSENKMEADSVGVIFSDYPPVADIRAYFEKDFRIVSLFNELKGYTTEKGSSKAAIRFFDARDSGRVFQEKDMGGMMINAIADNQEFASKMKTLSSYIVYVVAFSCVIGILLSFELRYKEFGLLRSLGMRDSSLKLMLYSEMLLNLIIAFAFSWFLIMVAYFTASAIPCSHDTTLLGGLYRHIDLFGENGHYTFYLKSESQFHWFAFFTIAVLLSGIIPILFLMNKRIILYLRRP